MCVLLGLLSQPGLEEMDHSMLEPKEACRTLLNPSTSYLPLLWKSNVGQHLPHACRRQDIEFRDGSDLPLVVSSELEFVIPSATLGVVLL